jgi:phage tail-like protein
MFPAGALAVRSGLGSALSTAPRQGGRTCHIATAIRTAAEPLLRFVLHNAWPCKYTRPKLNAKGNDVSIETLELCHERLEVEAP